MIELHDLRYAWPRAGRDCLAIDALQVGTGETLFLHGPSGCGKSTLLAAVAGLDADWDGRIVAPAERGCLFQTPRLMPWLTVRANLGLVLPGGQCTAQAEALLAAMDIEPALLGRYPAQLSGGQQRRVALARAFAVRPRLLLLDEPFVSLDAPVAQKLRELLLAHWLRERPTVLFVTHDLDEALALGDRIVFLGGRPAGIVLEQVLAEPRPRVPDAVWRLRRQLLSTHPELLSGRVMSDPENPRP